MRAARFRSGFILPLALAFLFVLVLLEAGLFVLQQRASQAALEESSRLAQLLATENLLAEELDALSRNVPVSGTFDLENDFTFKLPSTELELNVHWSNKDSLNAPMPHGWSTFNSVLKTSKLPLFSFDETVSQKQRSGTLVAPGHTFLALESSEKDHGSSVHSTSHLFPYGIYAPQGSIQASSVSSFANQVYGSSSDEETSVVSSGRPVDLLARDSIEVKTRYTNGQAICLSGDVSLPENDGSTSSNGALALSFRPAPALVDDAYFQGLQNMGAAVSVGALDKTTFFDTGLFDSQTLLAILKGDFSRLASVLSVGQACKVPFIPIPGMQDDILLDVFYLWHPYPPDFSGGSSADDKKTSEELKETTQKLKEARDKVKEIQADLDAELKKPKSDDRKVKELGFQLLDAQNRVSELESKVKKLNHKLDKSKGNLASNLSGSTPPETAAEEADRRTRGWAYLFVIGELFEIVFDILSGSNPFEEVETRVVHLGDIGPGWEWENDRIGIVGTITVPRGRTLKLSKQNITVEGDIYLHPGAVMVIDGNLTVTPPDNWSDFGGAPASDRKATAVFPNGRIIMEEGSSLIVQGNLRVEGGTVEEGSVLLLCDYGPNTGLSRLISVGGSLTLYYGTAPGVEFGVLVERLSKDRPALHGFFSEFFDPLTERIAPQIAKLPMVGPWQTRTCWFADYATTLEFIPWLEEFFGLGGPWPIPLPYPNCMTEVFKYVSLLYSAELNFAIGENFVTHSPFWVIFGRGVSPVSLKVHPDRVSSAVANIQWGKLFWEDFKGVAGNFLTTVLPELAKSIVEDVFERILEIISKEFIPFEPVYCGDPPEDPEEEVKTVRDAVLQILKEKAKGLPGTAVKSLFGMLVLVKNQAFDSLDAANPQSAILRELPGVCVVSGGRMSIGTEDGALMATGLFVSRQDIVITSKYTIGCVVSAGGDVRVENLLHYPYFDRGSFYKPKTFGTVLLQSLALEDPEGTLAGDLSFTLPRRLAEGWRAP